MIYECNACDWRGPGSETVHPKHDETCWVCPECHETVTPVSRTSNQVLELRVMAAGMAGNADEGDEHFEVKLLRWAADEIERQRKEIAHWMVVWAEKLEARDAEIERLREQLRLANIDACNSEAELNDRSSSETSGDAARYQWLKQFLEVRDIGDEEYIAALCVDNEDLEQRGCVHGLHVGMPVDAAINAIIATEGETGRLHEKAPASHPVDCQCYDCHYSRKHPQCKPEKTSQSQALDELVKASEEIGGYDLPADVDDEYTEPDFTLDCANCGRPLEEHIGVVCPYPRNDSLSKCPDCGWFSGLHNGGCPRMDEGRANATVRPESENER